MPMDSRAVLYLTEYENERGALMLPLSNSVLKQMEIVTPSPGWVRIEYESREIVGCY